MNINNPTFGNFLSYLETLEPKTGIRSLYFIAPKRKRVRVKDLVDHFQTCCQKDTTHNEERIAAAEKIVKLMEQAGEKLTTRKLNRLWKHHLADFLNAEERTALAEIMAISNLKAQVSVSEKTVPKSKVGKKTPPKQEVPTEIDIVTAKERIEKNLKYAHTQQKEEPNKNFTFSQIQSPIEEKNVNVLPLEKGKGKVGIASAQGPRKEMQDAHCVTTISVTTKPKKQETAQILGVFDGHGSKGDQIAQHVSKAFPNCLKVALEEQYLYTKATEEAKMFFALKLACELMNEEIKKQFGDPITSGATATVAVIFGNHIYVANVGDSRTVLVKKDKIVQLTEDQKPDMERYRKKIKRAGGTVTPKTEKDVARVTRGTHALAMARSLGDTDLPVSPNPKITRYPLDQVDKETFLILACDGLFDVASTNEVGKAVWANRARGVSLLAQDLVNSALESETMDNTTVLVAKISA